MNPSNLIYTEGGNPAIEVITIELFWGSLPRVNF